MHCEHVLLLASPRATLAAQTWMRTHMTGGWTSMNGIESGKDHCLFNDNVCGGKRCHDVPEPGGGTGCGDVSQVHNPGDGDTYRHPQIQQERVQGHWEGCAGAEVVGAL